MTLKYLCAAATVLLLGLSGPAARAESRHELYEKAKTEGALSIYGGGPTRLYEPWIKEFEATFPGIAVSIVGGYAGGLAPKIDAEIAAHHVAVDFVTFQAVQEFVRWKGTGVLLPFKPTGFAAIDPRFRDCARLQHHPVEQTARLRSGLHQARVQGQARQRLSGRR
jgi:iron(III) transport system substrate-binding protein